MSERSLEHATIVVDRILDAPPGRVFAAWATPEAKRRWFMISEHITVSEYALDFRVGGAERSRVVTPDGEVWTYEARYEDIVPGVRIVLAYTMLCNGERASVSLQSMELAAAGAGTRLVLTEQVTILDGRDLPADRERGLREFIEDLATDVQLAPASTK